MQDIDIRGGAGDGAGEFSPSDAPHMRRALELAARGPAADKSDRSHVVL